MAKTYVTGDIHGNYRALRQCLERTGFNYRGDRLIVLGDVCDRYPEPDRCIDELLRIAHCELVIGNHDRWVLDWATRGLSPAQWLRQGGAMTVTAYRGGPMPLPHIDFLRSGKLWIERGDRLFVHGGFIPGIALSEQSEQRLLCDRTLLAAAWTALIGGHPRHFGPYREIFVGHTPTLRYTMTEPIHAGNVWGMDTGAGWSGRLTMMDVETKQFRQSDPAALLYGPAGDLPG